MKRTSSDVPAGAGIGGVVGGDGERPHSILRPPELQRPRQGYWAGELLEEGEDEEKSQFCSEQAQFITAVSVRTLELTIKVVVVVVTVTPPAAAVSVPAPVHEAVHFGAVA